MQVPFSQRGVVSTLLTITFILIFLHLFAVVDRFLFPDITIISRRLYPLFNLNNESNLPSYFSSVLLLISAALLEIVALIQRQANSSESLSQASSLSSHRFVRHWQALSLIFLGLSIDESLALHEKTMPALRSALNADGIFYYPWVVPAIGLIVVLLVIYRRFLLSLPARIRGGILLAGGIYISGTVATEMVTGLWESENGRTNLTYALLVAVEESLEMLGLVLFIGVLLTLLRSIAETITFQFVKSKLR
ncbi:hypothetical protein [Leptolyngbya ohadii]|uniref:hypothetical protein n=1 Tax=Leptolyngbya ohadii TaxID=1962290 RepID=UPI000B59DE42|nr:hypothetical protein [Leptolyngbya ohadii]